MSDLVVRAPRPGGSRGVLGFGHSFIPCALGRSGTAPFHSEGDGTTPLGCWPLRLVFFRPDRLPRPLSGLPVIALTPDDGWCDAPDDARYNRAVKLPFRSSAENLWREDAIYDIILVPGINDNPAITGRGSALFIHIAREDLSPTQGCIAMRKRDLLHILPRLGPSSRLISLPASSAALACV